MGGRGSRLRGMFLGQLLCLFFVSPVQWTCSSTRDKGLPLMVLYVACPCSTLFEPPFLSLLSAYACAHGLTCSI